ncbi:MAG: redoxin domain-containing protein [Thermogutta sp.]
MERRLLWTPFCLAALFAIGQSGVHLWAAPPSVAQTLQLKPIQSGVEIDTPTEEEIANCTVAAEKVGDHVGWVVKDGRGYILRRFLDTNRDNRVDTWCYFRNGLEVYRDIDSDGDGKVDQFRWFTTAGGKWGVDTNQDGVIDRWQRISAEEVAEEAVRALVEKNIARFRALLLTPNEIKSLGLRGNLGQEVTNALQQAESQFQQTAGKAAALEQIKWVQFSGHRPGVLAASADGPDQDLLIYENAIAFAEAQAGTVQILLGTLVQVGSAWRLVTSPQLLDEQTAVLVQNNVFFKPPAVEPIPTAGTQQVSEKMQQLLDELEKLEAAAQQAQTLAQQAALNAKRAEIIEALEAEASRPEDKAMWIRQLADFLTASVQAGSYPDGVKRLEALFARVAKNPVDKDLPAYVRFRQLTAAYALAVQRPDVKYDEVQKEWMANLEQFLNDYPKAPDAAEALLQLGIGREYTDDIEAAKAAYQTIITQFANEPEAAKARGALRRLTSEGQMFELKGKDLQGGTVDVAAYRGKIVIVHFWTSWCEPCKTDMAILKDLVTRFGGKLAIVGVNLDTRPEEMQAYLAEARLPWPQIHELGGLESGPAIAYGIVTVPTTFLIDPQGRVVKRHVTGSELEAEIRRLAQ